MLYSSGTTGRPKGIAAPAAREPRRAAAAALRLPEHAVALPAGHGLPLAGAAVPLGAAGRGRPDAAQRRHRRSSWNTSTPSSTWRWSSSYSVSHSQLVPTMFSRMLKLPEDVRRTLRPVSLEIAVHAAAPCPAQVKQQMIAWWGPIIHEYYGATEGLGLHRLRQRRMARASAAPWAACCSATCTSSTRTMQPLPDRRARRRSGSGPRRPFEYFNDAERTRESRSADGR